MKSFKGLAHIAITVHDMEESLRFYARLGGECYATGEVEKPSGLTKLAMVRMNGFDLELIQPNDATAENTPALGRIPHIAIEVSDLANLVSRMKAMGFNSFCTEEIKVLPDLFGGLQNIFLTGPDGEQIELIEHFGK